MTSAYSAKAGITGSQLTELSMIPCMSTMVGACGDRAGRIRRRWKR